MTMVERVAARMWAKKEEPTPPPRVSWENAAPDERAFMLAIARAAIEAMREPSEAMVKRGADTEVMHSWGSPPSRKGAGEYVADPESIWSAMIDAALAEGDG